MLRLMKLVLIPTRREGYRNVYQRSFDVYARADDIASVERMLSTPTQKINSKLSEVAIANELSNVVTLSTMPTDKKPVDIVNGWGTERLRFLLEVEEDKQGLTEISYIQGYTEYSDLSMTGKIDPAMKFYINSICVVNKIFTPTGPTILPSRQFNVITDTTGRLTYQEIENNNNDRLIRPKDIMEDILTMQMFGGDFTNITNTTGNISCGVNTSSKINNDPINYLAKTMNGFLKGKSLSSISYETNDVLKAASANLSEPEISRVGFIQELHRLTHVIQSTVFDASVLEAIDPTIGSRTFIVPAKNSTNSYCESTYTTDMNFMDTTDTSELLNPTVENLKAASIVFSVNSMMADNLLSRIDLSLTNNTFDGHLIVTPLNGNSLMDGVDQMSYIERTCNQIETMLGPSLTDHGQTLITAYVSSELIGDTTISISVNNGPYIVFRYPIFADSSFAPVITNAATKEDTKSAFENLFDATYGINQNTMQLY